MLSLYCKKKYSYIINSFYNKASNWTSEGLISSPFVKAPEKREGYTFADIARSDFNINYADSGEIIVNPDAKVFTVIEAKMGSDLSQGTTHAGNYNQASRNISCILSNTFFCVVAPEKQIKKHDIVDQINVKKIYDQVKERFSCYNDEFKNKHNANEILARIEGFNSFTISYESWIASFDGETKRDLHDFYKNALKWNKL